MSNCKTEVTNGTRQVECAPIFMWEVEFDVRLVRNGETEVGGSSSHILAFSAEEAVETAKDALNLIESRHDATDVAVFLKGVVCIEQISAISARVLASLESAGIETRMTSISTNPEMN